ncbi:MAG: hypothetical protein K2W82_15545 [Candidatus Obscuribacterales bacterium]|nr:hypothetical protein [Candidatus Obscuribacterales bacterium]
MSIGHKVLALSLIFGIEMMLAYVTLDSGGITGLPALIASAVMLAVLYPGYDSCAAVSRKVFERTQITELSIVVILILLPVLPAGAVWACAKLGIIGPIGLFGAWRVGACLTVGHLLISAGGVPRGLQQLKEFVCR